MSFYSDEHDEDVQYRYRRRDPSPPPVNYVQARSDVRERPRSAFFGRNSDPFLVPERERNMAITRVRERSRERRSSPPRIVLPSHAPPSHPQTPVVITPSYLDHPSSDDESSVDSRRHGRGRAYSHSRASSRSRSRSRRSEDAYMTVRDFEIVKKLEDNRRQLDALRNATSPQAEAERYELFRVRQELEDLRAKEEREAQRKQDEEKWDYRKSKYQLEDLRTREEREAREKAEAARRAADYEGFELRQSRKELEDLRAREEREAREKADAARRAADFENFELIQSKRELEALKSQQKKERDAMEKINDARSQVELIAAKEELDRIKRAEQKDKEERRIRREIELKQLEEQRRAEEEREAREKADAEAVARWQAREAEKALKEQREKERADREYRQRMREHLLATGMSDDQIQAVLDKKKINETPSSSSTDLTQSKATYTRMARRHVSLETLRVKNIDFDLDVQNPEYVVIKRWVPPEEQQQLWTLTKAIRDGREQVTQTLSVEDRRHHHHSHHRHKSGDSLVVVKKTRRERSRSPSVSTLMYLAGAR
ncbi:hypothetical protein VPNG_00386 [Cytospora leucostoma]|uniref:DUF8035 domain-containing protein n=1 Tax=Cytospora leucostoma TaxID=1230097 RepID=A0A423XNS6_9PEZI|nr:hypothetical protein VPNG_00386 [Cytospora leucostoma]